MSNSGANGSVFGVLLCGGPRLFRAGLRSLIETRHRLRVVGDTEDATEGASVATWQQPAVVILDQASAGDSESLRRLRSRAPDARILGVARSHDLHWRRRIPRLGVDGWVATGDTATVFLDAIERLANLPGKAPDVS